MVGLDVAGAVREFRGLGDNWGQQGAGTVEASRQERAVAWRVLVSERVTAASTSLREEEGLLQELQKRLAKPGVEEGRWFLTDQISKQGHSPCW